jgi:hypothetical protein
MKGTYFSFPIVAIACAMFDSYIVKSRSYETLSELQY